MTRLIAGSLAMVVLLAAELPAQDPVATPRNPTPVSPGGKLRPPREVRVWTVSNLASDMADFSYMQQAIDRAGDGDIILVKRSPPVEVTIDGKNLTLIAGGPYINFNEIEIINVTGYVVLRGLRGGRIEADSCAGTIWIEQTQFSHLYPRDCESIVVTRCDVGGSGIQDIVGSNSNVAIWNSTLVGEYGSGGNGHETCSYHSYCGIYLCYFGFQGACLDCQVTSPPGPGGPAIWLMGTSTMFLSGSAVRGQTYSYDYCSYPVINPGPAIRTSSVSTVAYLDTVFTGSSPLIEGSPTLVDYARSSGAYTITSPVIGGDDAVVTLEGQPLTMAFVVANPVVTVASAPARFGVLVVRLFDSPSMFLGTVPMDGSSIVSSFPVGDLGPGEGSVLFTQSMFVEDLGGGMSETVLGAPSVLVQID